MADNGDDASDDGRVAVVTHDELEQILQQIPDQEARSRVQVLVQERFEAFRSPLLPPEVLKRYGNVVPGLPEKFVKWTEDESEHRRSMERAAFEEVRTLRARAQLSGVTVAIVGLLVSGLVAILTNSGAGSSAAIVLAIMSVGGPFAARLLASRGRHRDEADAD
jgi:uncharacterized membrane protein